MKHTLYYNYNNNTRIVFIRILHREKRIYKYLHRRSIVWVKTMLLDAIENLKVGYE